MSPATSPNAALPEDKIGRNDRAALLCCHEPTYAEYLAGELRLMGYKLHLADSHAEAIHRLNSRGYHLIVALENLEGCELAHNALLQHLAALPNDERRATYVVLLCQSFATSDEMGAYSLSVDQLVNYQDISQFASLVAPALEEHAEGNHHFVTVAARLVA
jgi:hypothetical protein